MHNVLLSTGRFRDAAHYAERSLPTASLEEAAAIFGARLLWGQDTSGPLDQVWTYTAPTAPVTTAAATAFLRRLLHSVVHPPPRDPRIHSPEHRPMTMVGLVEAVAHFHRIGSIPMHVLVGFLEDTLAEQARRLKAKSSISSSSRRSESDPAAHRYYELRALCRWYADRGVAPFTLLTASALWGFGGAGGGSTSGVKEYALAVQFRPLWPMIRRDKRMIVHFLGRPNDPVLGLALLRGQAANVAGKDMAPLDDRGLFGELADGSLLRRAARRAPAADGGGSVEVLSAVAWDDEACEARFLLCADDVVALRAQGVKVALIRTDSWDILSVPVALAEAKEAGPGGGV